MGILMSFRSTFRLQVDAEAPFRFRIGGNQHFDPGADCTACRVHPVGLEVT